MLVSISGFCETHVSMSAHLRVLRRLTFSLPIETLDIREKRRKSSFCDVVLPLSPYLIEMGKLTIFSCTESAVSVTRV